MASFGVPAQTAAEVAADSCASIANGRDIVSVDGSNFGSAVAFVSVSLTFGVQRCAGAHTHTHSSLCACGLIAGLCALKLLK
jgi:hypothetical protein